MVYSVLYSVVNTCLQVLQLTEGGVAMEIGLLVLQCVEEVLKPKSRLVLTLHLSMGDWTVLARILRLETAMFIRVEVIN